VSEYSEVERPFLLQLAEQGWSTIDQGRGVPQDPKPSMRESFRQWLLPEVFNEAIRARNGCDSVALRWTYRVDRMHINYKHFIYCY